MLCALCVAEVLASAVDRLRPVHEMTTYGPNHWNPPRVALCACGWVQTFLNLRAANIGAERHVADGCEGCDHVVCYADSPRNN